MKLADIILQLQRLLPSQTNLFSDTPITITNLVFLAPTVAATTATAHGLENGNIVNINGATNPAAISSLTRVGDVATAVTSAAHDLTEGFQEAVTISGTTETDYNGSKNTFVLTGTQKKNFKIQPNLIVDSITRIGTTATVTTREDHGFVVDPNFNVTVTGANPGDYNGSFNVLTVPTSKTFTYEVNGNPVTPATGGNIRVQAEHNRFVFFFIVEGAPSTPATGTPILEESQFPNFGYNGRYPVTVTGSTTFTYDITTTPNSPASGTAVAKRNVRVTGGVSIDRLQESYTPEAANVVSVTTITLTGSTATVTTTVDHFFIDDMTVVVAGANESEYNGNFVITSIPASNQFTYEVVGSPTTPATGTITATQQARLWAYVVLDDEITSKDRSTLNDSTATIATGNTFRLTEIKPFSVYVISPTTNDLSARPQRDLMVDVKRFMYKSLLGVKFPTDLTEEALGVSIPTGNGFFAFLDAFYIHRFQFEMISDINACDAIDPGFNTAFRCIDMQLINETRPILFDDTFNLDGTE